MPNVAPKRYIRFSALFFIVMFCLIIITVGNIVIQNINANAHLSGATGGGGAHPVSAQLTPTPLPCKYPPCTLKP